MEVLTKLLKLLLGALVSAGIVAAQEPLFPNSDFESGTLAGWTTEGEAFLAQPTRGDNPLARGRESAKVQGEYWIGGYERCTRELGRPGETAGDELVGTLTSPEFTVAKPYLGFRIGGGYLPGQVGVRLVCEGSARELATGFDSEEMEEVCAEVRELLGKRARLVVYDQATGGWGHVNVDEFVALDEPPARMQEGFSFVDGIPGEDDPEIGYDQPLRPQLHFSSRTGWLNDPNGMVYDGRRYHLFFQHNPLGSEWGNMTWGHATSPDMVHWTQGPHALLPYRYGRFQGTIYSGSAVVDEHDSLGLASGPRKTICAFFTFATTPVFWQAMAYSTDGGASFQYWNDGRAVVPNQGFDRGERDPKVFWHEPSQHWVMALWVQTNPGRVRFFTSKNLKEWRPASDLMRDWAFECMDVFFLPVDGDPANTKCVIADASFDYEIGTFDGETFHSESSPLHAGGGNFYAAQTFNQAPGGRVVQIGWMRGGPSSAAAYGLPFNQQMAFPCELALRTTPEGLRLCAQPIAELDSLVLRTHELPACTLSEDADPLRGFGPLDLLDVTLELDPGTASELILDLPHVSLRYERESGLLTHSGVDDSGKPLRVATLPALAPRDGSIRLRFLIDRLSLEAYAFDGELFAAHYLHPSGGAPVPSLRVRGGEARLRRLVLRELKSVWKP